MATKRYSNGMMFAVNYTWMKLEDQVNFFTNYDAEPYRDLQGDQRRHRLDDHDALRPARSVQARRFGTDTSGLVGGLIGGWQFNVIGEIQSGRPLPLDGSSVLLAGSARCRRASSRSTSGSTAAAPRSTTRVRTARSHGPLLGTNAYRVAKQRFPDVNEPTEPLWSISFFKTGRLRSGATIQFRVETFNVFNVRVYGAPNTNPSNASFGIVSTASQVNFPRTTQLGVRIAF